ncbi:alpha-L-rhamnosidase C-terminal domain-containing protein [Candidatus Chlorohelix sp.]|uniref:alpha-L-rhamnosidase-related protein n=1 Tax=Candidatus Chlorohelix sp. TaxID=3139201 RepID=UPI003034FECA
MTLRFSLLLLSLILAGALVQTALPSFAAASNPGDDWTRYVVAPPARDVFPQRIVNTALNGGTIDTPEGLLLPGGEVATIRRIPGSDPQLALDFGMVISGRLSLQVAASSGAEVRVAFSESLRFLNKNTDYSWKENHTYSWQAPAQGGTLETGAVSFRYVLLFLNSDGWVSVDYLKLHFDSYLGTPSTYKGWFLSSDELLNRIWYAGAYTVNLNTLEPEYPNIETGGGALRVSSQNGEQRVLSRTGADWRDYTLDMELRRPTGGFAVGWMFRSPDANNGYMWQISGDSGATVLKMHVLSGGQYRLLEQIPLRFEDNFWYTVRIELSGTLIRTFFNGQLVNERYDSSFSGGRVGFRQCCGETGEFNRVQVSATDGRTLLLDDFSGGLDAWDVVDTSGVLVDGTKHDRDIWTGDLSVQGRVSYLTQNRPGSMRASLAQLAAVQRPDGSIPPSSYNGYQIELYDYSAWWVYTLADYYNYTGDRAYLARYYPNLKHQMEWFPTKVNPSGLLVKDRGLEWSYSLNRTGAVTYLNMVYYRALQDAAKLADTLGQSGDAAIWRKRGEALKQAINQHLFDSNRGVYISADIDWAHVPQDANVLAVLFGVAPPERWGSILKYVKDTMWTTYGSTTVDVSYGLNNMHDKRIWPFMGYYEVEARFAAGDEIGALDLLRREWGRMLEQDPNYTTWEWMTADGLPESPDDSLAHGWSAGATAALTENVLGVRMTAPGYASFEIVPHPGDLQWAQGSVPTPHGAIEVSWQRRESGFQVILEVPEGTLARLGLPSMGNPAVFSASTNDNAFQPYSPVYPVSKQADGYFYMDLQPGSYVVNS